MLAGSFALGLELLLAAGLNRLATNDNFAALGLVAVTIVARRIIAIGVRQSVKGLTDKVPRIQA